MTTVAEAIAYLYDLRRFGTKLGLDNPRHLAACFGNPHHELKFIHVAGTNGKGSVCAMLESIYREAGYRVGLFTSPHLVDFRERIQVQRQLIPEADLVGYVSEIQSAIASLPQDHRPTFFEVVVILGLLHFHATQCDLVIWETGMGGRLDATNIVTPCLSIITNIALDHQKWLGDTIEKIALEKAGIIKPNIPMVHGAREPELQSLFASIASDLGSPARFVSPESTPDAATNAPLGLPGPHQQHNAALVREAVRTLQSQFPVSADAEARGLAQVKWPGRLQVIEVGATTLVLDGSHNTPSVAALCDFLEQQWPGKRPDIVLGVLEDKGIEEWLPRLVAKSNQCFLCPVKSGRTLEPKTLAAAISDLSPRATPLQFDNFTTAFQHGLQESTFLVVCGSIYLIGEAIASLQNQAADPSSIALNDWGGTPP